MVGVRVSPKIPAARYSGIGAAIDSARYAFWESGTDTVSSDRTSTYARVVLPSGRGEGHMAITHCSGTRR